MVAVIAILAMVLYVNYNSDRSRAGNTNLVDIVFSPSSSPVGSNTNNKVDVLVKAPSGQKLSGFNLTFVPTGPLQVVDVATVSSYPDGVTNYFRQIIKEQAGGNFHINYVINESDNAKLPNIIKITLLVNGTGTGNGTLTASKSDAYIVGPTQTILYDVNDVTAGSYQVVPGTNQAGGATVTLSPNAVTLSLKLMLQGVKTAPSVKTIPVRVKIAGGPSNVKTDYVTAQFTAGSDGVWTGKASFENVPAGSGYRVYIKGPMHIQRKFCDPTPTSTAGSTTCAGTAVTLKIGDNPFDFTTNPLLVGDLPPQDGVSDSLDLSNIRQNLGKTDAEATSKADLNQDGVVDSQDYALVLQTLSVKTDEE